MSLSCCFCLYYKLPVAFFVPLPVKTVIIELDHSLKIEVYIRGKEMSLSCCFCLYYKLPVAFFCASAFFFSSSFLTPFHFLRFLFLISAASFLKFFTSLCCSSSSWSRISFAFASNSFSYLLCSSPFKNLLTRFKLVTVAVWGISQSHGLTFGFSLIELPPFLN